MSNRKKTRKVGLIGVPKSTDANKRKPTQNPNKPKKRKGLAAGSRHNVETTGKGLTKVTGERKDPRLGSKKPISLIVESPDSPTNKERFFSPQQELKALEQDTRLNKLLDKLDDVGQLSREEQDYVDSKLARHKALCELLGIDEDQEKEDILIEDSGTDGDLLDQFEQVDVNQLGKDL